jgi:serine/threonine-protein kinase
MLPPERAVKAFQIGLLGRVALALAAVGLVPLAVVPYLVRLNRHAMADQVLRIHAVAARTTAARVGTFVESLLAAGRAAARNPVVYGDPRGPGAREALAGMLQSLPQLAGVDVEGPRGEALIRVQSRSEAEVVRAALEDPDPVWLRPLRAAGRLWFRLTVPLPEGRGRLRLVADASAIEEEARPRELGTDAALVLAGPSGVIAASAPGVTLESFPAALLASGRSMRASGSARYAAPGEDVLGAFAPVAGTEWFVLSRQPARVAEAIAHGMRQRALLAVGVALGLTGLLSAAAYRTLVRPLRDLVHAQRRLAGGGAGGASGNEVQQLRDAFAVLERQAHDRDAVGRVFLGRYQVLELVGTGGMGSVFKGWDPKLQRVVALKTVRVAEGEAGASRDEQVTTLLREAVTVAKFSHPNLVAVYDVEDAGDAAFIAMEYVDGQSLERYLTALGRLPPDQVVPLGAAMARGLAAAHAQGIIHRDVKPANVLLGRDGSIKVTDFGIADLISPRARNTVVFGTPGYLPPETLTGRGQTPLGDIFAIGVILYECLAGRSPFTGASNSELVASTVAGHYVPLREVAPDAPPEVELQVMALIAFDPAERRPDTAASLADGLEALASGKGWRFRPALAAPAARRRRERPPTRAVVLPVTPYQSRA